jgi:hypothetical protein
VYSKDWVIRALEELGGKAHVDVLRMMSVKKGYDVGVLDCYAPEYVDGRLSCIEGALKALEEEGVIKIEGGVVKLLKSPLRERAR